ncbi:MAG: T9SS type A sorting domain-containing protein [Flavobacteriales bacterium]|nr:T9SS type A sorting domain-containing protein [Flavobacteriales bacterium]
MKARCTLFLLFIASSRMASAQAPPMAWQSFFDGSLPGLDEANALLIAPDNSIYVTGGSTNIAPQGTITTIRYSASGAQLWADHPYGPSQDSQNKGVGMAIDPWGHVYVCANFSANAGDIAVIKYKPTGRIWRHNYEQYPTADVYDEARAIAVDAQGEVYVAGAITSTGGMGMDNYLLKVDSAGAQVWNNDFAVSSADEYATDVAISPVGHVYVGGQWWNTAFSGGVNMSVARFNGQGAVWNQSFEADGWSDYTAAIAPTANDGVLLCGSATINATADAVIVARNAAGAELWHVVHAGTGNVDDDAVEVSELSDGRVVAVVHSREQVGASLRHAITTLLIDDGAVVWSEQYLGDAALGAWPTDLAVDAADNIYISGYAVAAGNAHTDGVVLKYSAAGALVWSIPYDGGSSKDDRFNAIALNSAGDVVVCGSSHTTTTDSRYVTVQFGNAVGVQESGGLVSAPAVFPSPATDRVRFTGLAPNAPAQVFDALGQFVAAVPRTHQLDVSDWTAGLYFLRTPERTVRFVVGR